jgi:hypothetical protein
MALRTEIKDFIRRVLLVGILLSFAINFLVTTFTDFGNGGSNAFADSNELTFKKSAVPYLWDTAVALSFNIGLSKTSKDTTPVRLYEDVIPLSAVLADKTTGRNEIIASHMIAAQEYINILQMDINATLDQSNDREAMLESMIDGLQYRGKKTNEYLKNLSSQRTELQTAINEATARSNELKAQISKSYAALDFDGTQEALDAYIEAKNKETHAKSYIVFLDKFASTYTALNTYNSKLIGTLIANKEPLIKNVTVVLPDTGNEFLKKLQLVSTEADVKNTTAK